MAWKAKNVNWFSPAEIRVKPTFSHFRTPSRNLVRLPCFAGFVGHFEVLSEREEVVENLLVLSQLFT